jgi:hypothetical protein
MPLSHHDRRFLQTIDRMKMWLLLMAVAVFLVLILAPSGEIQMATCVLGIALCGVFWLTQRLLSFISTLDLELTRVVNTLKRTLPKEQQEELFR